MIVNNPSLLKKNQPSITQKKHIPKDLIILPLQWPTFLHDFSVGQWPVVMIWPSWGRGSQASEICALTNTEQTALGTPTPQQSVLLPPCQPCRLDDSWLWLKLPSPHGWMVTTGAYKLSFVLFLLLSLLWPDLSLWNATYLFPIWSLSKFPFHLHSELLSRTHEALRNLALLNFCPQTLLFPPLAIWTPDILNCSLDHALSPPDLTVFCGEWEY